MASPNILEEILSNLNHLPELPAVALQVYRLMEDPQTSARDLAKVIMIDPGLTTKVLRLCNSAEYGIPRKIATISEAVSILGYKEIKRIVFVIISHSFLNRPVRGYALEKGELWDNALTCASYAQHIARKVHFMDGELAFIAALLRDVGKVALESYMVGQSELLEDNARKNKISFAEAEENVLGVSHTEVGSQLASRWNLPDSLVTAIAYHHTPSKMPASLSPQDVKLTCIVHLADVFTMMTGKGVGVDGLMYPLDPKVFEVLPLEPDSMELEVLYAELLKLQEKINEITTSFDGVGEVIP